MTRSSPIPEHGQHVHRSPWTVAGVACSRASRRCAPPRSGKFHRRHIAGRQLPPPDRAHERSGSRQLQASSAVRDQHQCWMPQGPRQRQFSVGIKALAGGSAVEAGRGRWGQKLNNTWAQARPHERSAADRQGNHAAAALRADHSKTAERGPWGVSASGGSQWESPVNCQRPWWNAHLSIGRWQVWGPPSTFCPDGWTSSIFRGLGRPAPHRLGGGSWPAWRWEVVVVGGVC